MEGLFKLHLAHIREHTVTFAVQKSWEQMEGSLYYRVDLHGLPTDGSPLVSRYSLICVSVELMHGKQGSNINDDSISDQPMPVDETDLLTASAKVMPPLFGYLRLLTEYLVLSAFIRG